MNGPTLVVSPHPHIHSGNTVQKIMIDFMLALFPAVLFGLYLFGFDALRVILISVGSAIGWQALSRKVINKPFEIHDLTAAASGLILAMLLPATTPWWLILIGTLIMIVLGSEVFGGYGSNPFNSVLVAWIILKMSYPDFMIDWGLSSQEAGVLAAPMEIFKNQGPSFLGQTYGFGDLFLGTTAGPIGHVSVLMLLIGGLYLLARKTVNWRIPISYLAGVFLFSGLFWIFSPGSFADPLFHLLAGGTFLAAFFLATDMPSSPVTPEGMIIFGFAAGCLTAIIRMWGAWTFGAFYAVLIMSMATPFLDKIAPEVYGR